MVHVQSCCFANQTYFFFFFFFWCSRYRPRRWILKSLFPHLIRCPVAGYFWKRRFFSCVLAFCPCVNGVFGHLKCRFSIKVLECRFRKTPASRLRVDERKRWCHTSEPLVLRVLRIRCYRISIVLVFSCGRTNTLSVDVCFWKRREKKYPDNDHDNGNKNLTNKFAF